jgi:hypothetical protein
MYLTLGNQLFYFCVTPTTAALSTFNYSLIANTLTFIFTLTAPAPADLPVHLAYTPNNPGFPVLITIPAGNTNYQMSIAVPMGS